MTNQTNQLPEYNSAKNFYSGTSNVVLPVPNKTYFPPSYQDKTRLTYYASLFNSVEVNSTFYKLPLSRTIEKWTTEVPDDFRFSIKLWQDITHKKELAFNPDDLTRFMKAIDTAGNKKGCLLFQFPPSLMFNIPKCDNLLQQIQQINNGWKLAIEFRNTSWYKDDTYELLSLYNAGMVLHDMAKSTAPIIETASDFIFLRFHGPEGGYRGSYTDDFLYEYATYIKDWLQDSKIVYVYFNNTVGSAVHNLITLNSFVNQE